MISNDRFKGFFPPQQPELFGLRKLISRGALGLRKKLICLSWITYAKRKKKDTLGLIQQAKKRIHMAKSVGNRVEARDIIRGNSRTKNK